MKNISKVIVASALLAAGSTAMAGGANLSITSLSGHGSSITKAGGTTSLTEQGSGWRFMNSSTDGDVSARAEWYSRDSSDVTTFRETTNGGFTMTGQVVDATRVGESKIRSTSTQRTTGKSWNTVEKTEDGNFVAYDNVEVGGSNSSSFESGTYDYAENSYANTDYSSRITANTRSYNAYANYGAN